MVKKKRIAIITGITSFLGRSMAKKLLSKNFCVFGIVRPESNNVEKLKNIKGLKLIYLDFDKLSLDDFDTFNDESCYISNIKKYAKDITIFHFAWGSTLDRNNFAMQMLNIDMSKKILKFAKLISANNFIFAGSQAELSDSAYGMAKKQFADFATYDLKDSDMQFIHLRIFSIYGKEDRDTSLIKSLISHCESKKDIDLSSCEFKWNFLFIDDFTDILYKLILSDAKTGEYDIASDDTRLLKDYVIEAHKTLKSSIKLNFGARPDSTERFSLPDIRKTIAAIGKFNFTKFNKGILLTK